MGGKNKFRVTGHVSSHHSLVNRELLVLLEGTGEGAGCRAWLVTTASLRHVTFHLNCNSRVSTSI